MYDVAAGGAGLAMVGLPALETVRDSLHRDVLVAGQGQVTRPAAEVLQMPEPVLGRCVLLGEDELVTSFTPGDVHLIGEVSTTVKMLLGVVVEEVLQHLPALPAREAVGMPAGLLARPLSKYGQLSWRHPLLTTCTPPTLTRAERPLSRPESTGEEWHGGWHQGGRGGSSAAELGENALTRHVLLHVLHVATHLVNLCLRQLVTFVRLDIVQWELLLKLLHPPHSRLAALYWDVLLPQGLEVPRHHGARPGGSPVQPYFALSLTVDVSIDEGMFFFLGAERSVKYFPDPILSMVSLVKNPMLCLPTATVLTDFLPVVKLEARALITTSLTGSSEANLVTKLSFWFECLQTIEKGRVGSEKSVL